MEILVTMNKGQAQRFLVKLITKKAINEVRKLIRLGKHTQALKVVCEKAVFERHVLDHELTNIKADLLLSENGAGWDLKK